MSRHPLPFIALAGVAAASVVAASLVSSAAASTPATSRAPRAGEPVELTLTASLPYDRERLAKAARSISTPGSPQYRKFLSLKQASSRFGATSRQRDRLRAWAKDHGMTVSIDATGLTARITGPTETWKDLFRSDLYAGGGAPAPRLVSYYLGSQEQFANQVPASMKGVVAGIIPVYNVLEPATRAAEGPPLNTGEPFGPGKECLKGSLAGIPLADLTYSPKQLHMPYGTAALHRSGVTGKGSRLVIVGDGQSYAPGVAEAAADCFGYRAPTVRTTGAFGMPDRPVMTMGFGGIESNLDLQTAAGVLPGAERIGFVETAAGVSFILSLIDGFTTAYQRLNPDVISLSYGYCMTYLASAGDGVLRWMSDDVFALGAILGTSIVVSTGDSGSSACLHNGFPDPNLNVGYPGASPWVTAVGGTRIVLGKNNVRVDEVVWNDSTWKGSPGDDSTAGAGTGGPSPYAAPWYQARTTGQDRRIVPDVSAHASGAPGWPVAVTPEQFEAFAGSPLPPGTEWAVVPVGGTSASTPFTAANVALIASRKGRLGFLNPWLYGIASTHDYRSAFYDVTRGMNQVAPPAGCCTASRGFDQATGLGAPHFDGWLRLAP